jgi:dihydrodiol dehydrogenase / D-xylose 1-dehydrogenase (NADP)
VRFGVIGTAAIGLDAVIPAIETSEHTTLGIASRDAATAEGAARKHDVPRAYGSY